MAVTVTFVKLDASPNILKYKMTATGAGTGQLTCSGAATPDGQTDSVPGAVRSLLAASYASQAAARTALMEGAGAEITIESRTAGVDWIVDVGVSGTNPVVNVTAAAADALGAILTIRNFHTIIR